MRKRPRRPSSIGSAGSAETVLSKPGPLSRTMRRILPQSTPARDERAPARATVLASSSPMINSLERESSVTRQSRICAL